MYTHSYGYSCIKLNSFTLFEVPKPNAYVLLISILTGKHTCPQSIEKSWCFAELLERLHFPTRDMWPRTRLSVHRGNDASVNTLPYRGALRCEDDAVVCPTTI